VTSHGPAVTMVVADLRTQPDGRALARAIWNAADTGQAVPQAGLGMAESDFLAADATRSSPAWLSAADVVLAAARRPAALRAVLLRHPGCLLTVAMISDRECLAVSRDEAVVLAVCRGHARAAPLAGAALVYGWMTAGLPLAVLGRGQLLISCGRAWPAHAIHYLDSPLSVSLRAGYEPGPPDSRTPIRSRTSPASGPPVSQ
jgi:hypothetical protein